MPPPVSFLGRSERASYGVYVPQLRREVHSAALNPRPVHHREKRAAYGIGSRGKPGTDGMFPCRSRRVRFTGKERDKL